MDGATTEQKAVCRKYSVPFVMAERHLNVGIALNVKEGLLPLNGLRHPITATTTGWYLWAGKELKSTADFFVPVCVVHLEDWCPQALRFLGLPPGWRFLVAGEHEDVWYDAKLLEV